MKWIGRTLIILIVATMLVQAPMARAQDNAASFVVQIRAGSCDAPGDGLAQLEDVDFSANTPVGASDAALAASSYSLALVSLDTMTASPAAVFVLDGESHAAVACGEIGGAIGADGSLSIGLRSLDDSGLSGIVYLAPNAANPAQTGISTFLSLTGPGNAEATTDTAMDIGAYSAMVRNQLTILVGSLNRVGALFDSPNAADAGWVSQVNGELFLWKLLYRVSKDVVPPASLASFHNDYLDALAQLDSAASDITQALQTNDETLLTSASTKIQDAVATLRALDASAPSGTPTAATPTP